jgi:hypothetical protein
MMRVIVNGVSFYTTQQRVKDGVGDNTTVNQAVRAVYGLVKWYKTNCVSTRVAVYDHKMQQQYFDVQIDKL